MASAASDRCARNGGGGKRRRPRLQKRIEVERQSPDARQELQAVPLT